MSIPSCIQLLVLPLKDKPSDKSTIDLTNAVLKYADLTAASLYDADLTNADLNYADLTNAYFQDADLEDATLVEADLKFTKFSGATVTGANFDDTYWHETMWTDGLRYDSNQA